MPQRDSRDNGNNPTPPPFNKGGMGGFSGEKAVLSFRRIEKAGEISLAVDKTYIISGTEAKIAVGYTFSAPPDSLENAGSIRQDLLWGVELNLTLLAGNDPKRYYRFPGKIVEEKMLNSIGTLEDVTEVHLVDEWQGIEIRLNFNPAARFWRFPIETISQSEKGLESTYQGSCLLILWPLSLPIKGRQEGLITMMITER